jgi:hypothetical protein
MNMKKPKRMMGGGSARKNAPKMMKRGGKVKKMADGGDVSGRTISNRDIARALGESDRTISDRDRERIRKALMPTAMGESGRTISDVDRKRLK